jgi:hypothetical protein
MNILDYFVIIFESLYGIFTTTRVFFKKNTTMILCSVIFMAFVYVLHNLYIHNPINVMKYFQSSIIIVFMIVLFIFATAIISIKHGDTKAHKVVYKSIQMLLLVVSIYIAFSVFMYLSKSLIYLTATQSFALMLITTYCLLGLIYYFLLKHKHAELKMNSSTKSKLLSLVIDVIFYIPCIFIDVLEQIKGNTSKLSSSSIYVVVLTCIFLLTLFMLPILKEWVLKDNGIELLSKKTELNREVLYVDQEELRKAIIEKRPFLTRSLLKLNNEIENYIKIHNGIFKPTSLFSKEDLLREKKYISGLDELSQIQNHDYCTDNAQITCDTSNNVILCNGNIVKNYYNINETCDTNLLKNLNAYHPQDIMEIYDVSQNRLSLQEICDVDVDLSHVPTRVVRLTYDTKNDTIDKVMNQNNDLDGKTVYACRDISNDEYKVIYGYYNNDDNDDIKGPIVFETNPTNIDDDGIGGDTEGFGMYVENTYNHKMDAIMAEHDLLKSFSEEERQLFKRALNDNKSNMKDIMENIANDPDKIQLYLMSYFSNNDNYMTLLNRINKYNNENKTIINQETSRLVKYINMTMKIHTFNYHYGIVFWLYLDPSLMNHDKQFEESTIFTYGNQPRIYFDHSTKEICLSIRRQDKTKTSTNIHDNDIYRTKNILYQRWNLFVVNYNYGELDLFINNNLVANADHLSPYIDENMNVISFGSENEPLEHCGICSVKYYEEPLELSKISDIYKLQPNPCGK